MLSYFRWDTNPIVSWQKKANIAIDEDGFIAVDEYMRTHTKDVFAVGDCAQKRDFVTRRRVATMLASTACAEARVAGMNLFNLHVVKTFTGTIAIYSTAIGDTGLAQRRNRTTCRRGRHRLLHGAF